MFALLSTQLGRLRILAFLEGCSFLIILFITMPLKYIWAYSQPNAILGMAHGVLFMLYLLWVLQLKIEKNWAWSKMSLAMLAAIVPFGTFWADKKLFRAD